TPVDEDRLMEALHGLAKMYIRQNKKSQAEPVLRRAAEIARRSLNQPILIPEIIEVLNDYSKVLRDLSDRVDADLLHAEAQRIRFSAAFIVEAKHARPPFARLDGGRFDRARAESLAARCPQG